MAENHPMGFDWIFFVIVFTPVLIAAWELYRIRKEPKAQLEDPWRDVFGLKVGRAVPKDARPVRDYQGR